MLSVHAMIEGVVGFPGGGKTYYGIYRALKEIKKGRPVYSNFGIKGQTGEITPQTMFDIEPGAFIVLDEAQNWFGSRDWAKLGDEYTKFFSQTRKKGYTLMWISQDVSTVDKIMRDRTHIIYECQSWFGGVFGHPLFFTIQSWYGAKNIHKEKFRAINKMMFFSKRIAESYDTNEMINSRSQFPVIESKNG
jgi:hypothetical protein